MSDFRIGDNVYVGGCVGAITDIYNDKVEVSGVYFYYDIEIDWGEEFESFFEEPWCFIYSLQEFNDSIVWNEKLCVWDAEGLAHTYS